MEFSVVWSLQRLETFSYKAAEYFRTLRIYMGRYSIGTYEVAIQCL